MSIRPKLLLILAIGVVPLVALSVVNYLNGVKVVEAQLRTDLARDAQAISRNIKSRLAEREEAMVSLANSRALKEYLSSGERAAAPDGLPEDLQQEIRNALEYNRNNFVAIACVDGDKHPLFRAELDLNPSTRRTVFQTQDFLQNNFVLDERVWSASEETPLRSAFRSESYGAALRYTVPVFVGSAPSAGLKAALIVDLRLDALFAEAAGIADTSSTTELSSPASPRLVVMIDTEGNIVYHTNSALRYQPVATAMSPSFSMISNSMRAGQSGSGYYDSVEGDRWLAVYQPVQSLNLSVAVAGNHTAAIGGLRWMGWLSAGLTLLIGILVAGLLLLTLGRTTRSIQRVTEGAVAIAGGNLNDHIEVRSSDETRLLAETFNAMTDRLREQIARETESRQFESFLRLSAILTHDLKNSILALSLLVSNMEQQFDNAEFRTDAMTSLTQATDKLRALVAKLSEPARSLSGEFKRPRPVDLVPVINRVLARMATPDQIHQIDAHLPSTLVAVADEERIERVVENLVLNALEAMDTNKGKLDVEAGAAEKGFVFFSVCDTGPGMSATFQRTNLFRPFATTKTNGVGLGLYTCRELITALGGRIETESERGSGTCFRVVLPSARITESV
ncbi:MAG: hypothetical protein QOJ64_2583 [Acidobacteriota bacterium]|jgi:signal transduction histidine kinase|nr:hypothetical protein [Acidobacteriota bacterium]